MSLSELSAHPNAEVRAASSSQSTRVEVVENRDLAPLQVALQTFLDDYGAIAECENVRSMDDMARLRERIETMEKIHLSWPGKQLFLDEKGQLSWQPRSDSQHYMEQMKQNIGVLYKRQQAIIDEFHARSLDPSHPLQDLRDRLRRLQVLRAERNFLQKHMPVPRDFWTIPLKNATLTELNNKMEVLLGKRKITFNGQTIPVELRAKIDIMPEQDKEHFTGTVCFSIQRTDKPSLPLASFQIGRAWGSMYDLPARFYSESSIRNLRDRKLLVDWMQDHRLFDRLGVDSNTGTKPATRLALEVMSRLLIEESEETLVVHVEYPQVKDFSDAGFTAERRYPEPAACNELIFKLKRADCKVVVKQTGPLLPRFFGIDFFKREAQ